MKKNVVQKYLTQKKVTAWDIFGIVGTVIAVFIWIFVWRDIAIPVLFVSVAMVAVSRTSRVKDVDFERELETILRDNDIYVDEKVTGIYDVSEMPIVCGSDGVLRSGKYIVEEFARSADGIKIFTAKVDLINRTVEKTNYDIPSNAALSLVSEPYINGRINKKIWFLKCENPHLEIPIDYENEKTYELINEILEKE